MKTVQEHLQQGISVRYNIEYVSVEGDVLNKYMLYFNMRQTKLQ